MAGRMSVVLVGVAGRRVPELVAKVGALGQTLRLLQVEAAVEE